MPRPDGSLQRSMVRLTVGVARSMRARERRDREMGLAEMEEQFQVEISGNATTGLVWASQELSFDCSFHYAPGQRDSELDRPQFWFGAVVSPAVLVTAVVTAWTVDEDTGATIGATVAIGVMAAGPGAYAGHVHLTFQGYGALIEEDTVDAVTG